MLVKNFRDHSLIKTMEDTKLAENDAVLKWFESWEINAKENPSTNTTLVATTLFDLKSMIIGFKQLYKIIFTKYQGILIYVNKINTDIVENTFGQARARNGQNDNPTVAEYGNLLLINLVTFANYYQITIKLITLILCWT